MSVSDGSGYGFGDDGGGDDAFGGFEGEQGGTRKVGSEKAPFVVWRVGFPAIIISASCVASTAHCTQRR